MPSLFTIAEGAVIFFRASIALLAFPSCMTPTVVFKTITARIIAVSLNSLSNMEMEAAIKRMKIMGSFICACIISHMVCSRAFFKTLPPSFCRRCPASASDRPFFSSVPKDLHSSLGVKVSYMLTPPATKALTQCMRAGGGDMPYLFCFKY